MLKYTLLSGEKIDLSPLSEEECRHIDAVESLIEQSSDYFKVFRSVYAPITEGKSFDTASLHSVYASSRYKVVADMLERYRQKLFPQL